MRDPTLDKIYTQPPQDKLTSTTQPKASLDGVLQELETWRSSKPNPSTPIPDDLWHKIFELAKIHTGAKIRSLLGISTKQYNSKYEQFFSHVSTEDKSQVNHSKVSG